MSTLLTPNMSLPVPVVGVEPGPQFAEDVNNCFTLVDSHNHAPGSGVQIDPTGLDINADLTMQANNLIEIRSLRLAQQTEALELPTDLSCIYDVDGDMYFNDGLGNQIRLTQNGSIVGTAGSISGLVAPATASYVGANETFVWQSDVDTAANLDCRAVILRTDTPSSAGITVRPPASIASDYDVVLPALPGATALVAIDSSGNMTAPYPTTGGIPLAALVAAVQASLNPAGAILAYGGAAAPTGYLVCDGSAVSRATYAALFTAIGENFGQGDNSTTFNLPDLRGRFLRGVDGAAARDPNSGTRTAMNTGGNSGNNVGSVQTSTYGSHRHGLWGVTAGAAGSQQSLLAGGTDSISLRVQASPDDVSAAMDLSGGSETRPINAYVTYIIKT